MKKTETMIDLLQDWMRTAPFHLIRQVGSVKDLKIEISSSANMTVAIRVFYNQVISYNLTIKEKKDALSVRCSCFQSTNCIHTVEAVSYLIKHPEFLKTFYDIEISSEEEFWLDSLKETDEEPLVPKKNSEGLITYMLYADARTPNILSIGISSAKQKKNMEFKALSSKTYLIEQIYEWPDSIKKHIALDDWALIQLILQNKIKADINPITLLKKLINSGRCFFYEIDRAPLTWGKEKKGEFEWNYAMEGEQTIQLKKSPWLECFFLNKECVYVDCENNSCGILSFPISTDVAKKLLKSPPIQIRKADLIQKKLSTILKNVPVKEKPFIILPKTKPSPHLYLSKGVGFNCSVIDTTLLFSYGKAQVSYELMPKHEILAVTEDAIYQIKRDLSLESATRKILLDYGFLEEKYPRSIFKLPGDPIFEDHVISFLQTFVYEKKKEGWTFSYSEDFPYQNVYIAEEWYANTVESKSNWFDLELGSVIDGKRVNLIPALRRVLDSFAKNGISFESFSEEDLKKNLILTYEKKDAISIPFSRLKMIFSAFLGILDSTENSDTLKLSKWNTPALGDLQESFVGKLAWQAPQQYTQLKELLKRTKKIQKVDPPKGLKCELRPYQLEGVSWLQFLRDSQLSGILADDMGLGKTIQTLAHILLEKESGRMQKPALVIAPTTLMNNWLKESEKFAPSLKVLILQGGERKKHFETLYEYDIILTTYPLLARDQEILVKHEFHLLILDEAQNIKNAQTQAHHTIRLLNAQHKLCLTGTPIENHLGELWAFFHILLPGFLGDEKQFQRLFRKPIEKEGSLERKAILQKRIHPFMLRRTKKEVALDLPPKTEILSAIELTQKQKDLYEAVRLTMMKKVLSEVENKGIARSHIIVLDALLKLRQICCDPRLLKNSQVEVTAEDSAKLSYLMGMVEELLEEKRQILLFSQFTSMLALIEKELVARSIPYAIITGDTKDRSTPVTEFQDGTKPLMLISLKAGGTGLNLTAADTVIHYDPWWNPAVENQATDRAHRIGQTKPVFVYKFIATGSIEEKILHLQSRKKAMADGLFDESNTKPLEMNLEDLHSLFEPLTT